MEIYFNSQDFVSKDTFIYIIYKNILNKIKSLKEFNVSNYELYCRQFFYHNRNSYYIEYINNINHEVISLTYFSYFKDDKYYVIKNNYDLQFYYVYDLNINQFLNEELNILFNKVKLNLVII